MAGRYGFDQLGKFLFALSFVFWAACAIVRFLPFYRVYLVFSSLNTIIYVYAIFRILSKNCYQRTVENERYLRLRNKIAPFIKDRSSERRDKNYVFKKCPRCKSKLRLKRIKGTHTAQCPRCGKKFRVRVFVDYYEDVDY